MTNRVIDIPDRFALIFDEDGYDAYGVIQSYPLTSERYVPISLDEIDTLIEGLEILKVKLQESGALAK